MDLFWSIFGGCDKRKSFQAPFLFSSSYFPLLLLFTNSTKSNNISFGEQICSEDNVLSLSSSAWFRKMRTVLVTDIDLLTNRKIQNSGECWDAVLWCHQCSLLAVFLFYHYMLCIRTAILIFKNIHQCKYEMINPTRRDYCRHGLRTYSFVCMVDNSGPRFFAYRIINISGICWPSLDCSELIVLCKQNWMLWY